MERDARGPSAHRPGREAHPRPALDLPHLRRPHQRPRLQRPLPRQPLARTDRPLDCLRPPHPVRLRLRPPARPARDRQGRRAHQHARRLRGPVRRHSDRADQHLDDHQRDRDVAPRPLRGARRAARGRPGAPPGHDAERHHQGVPGARHLHLPAPALDAADRRHVRLLPAPHPALEPVQHLLLPPAGGGGDARTGARLRARQCRGVARRHPRARLLHGRRVRAVRGAHLVLRERRHPLRRGALQDAGVRRAVGRDHARPLRRHEPQVPALPLRRAGELARAHRGAAREQARGTSSGRSACSRSSPTRPTSSSTPTCSTTRRSSPPKWQS